MTLAQRRSSETPRHSKNFKGNSCGLYQASDLVFKASLFQKVSQRTTRLAFLFEIYVFGSCLGQLCFFTFQSLSSDHFFQDVNLLSLLLAVVLLLRRPVQTYAWLKSQPGGTDAAERIPAATAAVSAYAVALVAAAAAASSSMTRRQIGFVLHTIMMWLLMVCICSSGSLLPEWPWRVGRARGARAVPRGGAASCAGQGRRARPGPSVGRAAEARRVSAGRADDTSPREAEAHVAGELWRLFAFCACEAGIAAYVTCVLPASSIRRESLYSDRVACGVVAVFLAVQLLLLLLMRQLAWNWPCLLQWADVLGCWRPLLPETDAGGGGPREPPQEWAADVCYPSGHTVRHNGCAYVALGKSNAASPDSTAARLLAVLASPRMPIPNLLVIGQGAIMVVEAVVISQAPFWKPLMANFLLSYGNLFAMLYMRRAMVRQTEGHLKQ